MSDPASSDSIAGSAFSCEYNPGITEGGLHTELAFFPTYGTDLNHDGLDEFTFTQMPSSYAVLQENWPEICRDTLIRETVLQGHVQDKCSSIAGHITGPSGQKTPPQAHFVTLGSERRDSAGPDAARRTTRARNAAIKRHAKAKEASGGAVSSTGVAETQNDSHNRHDHRERNRVAAAKCRAKKKVHHDFLEELHRNTARKNQALKAELMGLRNERAQLQNLTLQHGPDNCHCEGIQEYTERQANLLCGWTMPQCRQ